MPQKNNEGWQPTYVPLEGGGAVVELIRFVKTIISTMQNWRDIMQARAPGYRDRIVHIRIGPEEGGMNLDMPRDVVEPLTQRGTFSGADDPRYLDPKSGSWEIATMGRIGAFDGHEHNSFDAFTSPGG
jgi:hypothetical protein